MSQQDRDQIDQHVGALQGLIGLADSTGTDPAAKAHIRKSAAVAATALLSIALKDLNRLADAKAGGSSIGTPAAR